MSDEVVTYLEMTSPLQLRPGRVPAVAVDVVRAGPADVPMMIETNLRVAWPYEWSSLLWSPGRWAELIVDTWCGVVRIDGRPGGVLMHVAQPDGNVEITTFGLASELVGTGVGGHALTLALRQAWNTVDHDDLAPVRRVWLHTSSRDHPHALPNYRARGLRPFWSRSRR